MQSWFTRKEAAEYCRISLSTLGRWVKAGRLRHYDGKYFRADLDAAIMKRSATIEEIYAARTPEPENVVTSVEVQRIPTQEDYAALASSQNDEDRAHANAMRNRRHDEKTLEPRDVPRRAVPEFRPVLQPHGLSQWKVGQILTGLMGQAETTRPLMTQMLSALNLPPGATVLDDEIILPAGYGQISQPGRVRSKLQPDPDDPGHDWEASWFRETEEESRY